MTCLSQSYSPAGEHDQVSGAIGQGAMCDQAGQHALNIDTDSLCNNSKETNLIINASDIPRIIWKIKSFGLNISNWTKLLCQEL